MGAELQIRISPLSQSLRQILTHLPTTKTANMIIYKDILTGDEIISDSYDLKEVDGAVYEVDCAMITLGAVEVNTGANASAEEAEEGVEDGALQVNNVVNSFRLNSTHSIRSHISAILRPHEEGQGGFEGEECPRGDHHRFREGCSSLRQEDCRQLQGLRFLHWRVDGP